jgi:phage-related protein
MSPEWWLETMVLGEPTSNVGPHESNFQTPLFVLTALLGALTKICWHSQKTPARKSFDDVGVGTKEIRMRDASGIYRVMYVAKYEEAVYVWHCLQKKTRTTTKQDKAIAAARCRAVAKARKGRK